MINAAQLPPWLAMVMGLAACAMESPPSALPVATADQAAAVTAPALASPISKLPQSKLSQRLLRRLNHHRRRNHLETLVFDGRLGRAAARHAEDMARNRTLSHRGSGGSRLKDRIGEAGYRFQAVAENIASGAPSPERVVELWMASPGHRANILNPVFRDAGIGHAGGDELYWTLDLGRKWPGGGKRPLRLPRSW